MNDVLQIIHNDALSALRELPDESVQCVVTSPPYFGLRDYGVAPRVWDETVECEHEFVEARQYQDSPIRSGADEPIGEESCQSILEIGEHFRGVDWVVVGGESGKDKRRCYVPNVRSVVRQCREARVPVFVKQLGGFVVDRNDAGFDGCEEGSWPFAIEERDAIEYEINGYREEFQGADVRIHLLDKKGGDINEWPEDLRVREFPIAA